MSTLTPNLNLEKPANNEYIDIDVINDNYDIIDTAVAAQDVVKVTSGSGTAASVGQLQFKDSVWKGLDEIRLYNGTDPLYCKEGVTTGLLMQNNQIKIVPVTWNNGVPAVGTMKGYIDANGDYHIYDSVTTANNTSIATLRDSVSEKISKSGDELTGALNVRLNDIDLKLANNGVSTTRWPSAIGLLDKNGYGISFFGAQINSSGRVETGLYSYNRNSSGESTGMNYIRVGTDKDGTISYSVNGPATFRGAIGAAAASDVKNPIGYNWNNRVYLINYSETNPYTAISDGIVMVTANWRQSSYAIAFIQTGTDTPMGVELASPSNGNSVGTQTTWVPVFQGQKMWGTRNPDVAYGDVYFIPFKY